ncbi:MULTISPECIES: class F sortase [Paenarthrobacter]|uniref:Class F sortase n=1 Tax=Paenarthrobacter ureafaciens TaxID=37931 RepID=A0AAX3EQP4_PAEUR|nr:MULTISPECIES: class F sortase [Paenarthrobacter]MDO5867082.1 class F sortase [Paenarthrobacter sp. SD-2]MDO5878251.1 class F sortase [Paenarthrobacter sp. SD-1]UYV95523.1 class F sortase [Paenarthrobacter ureafaciens]UYW00124.1 class F sortase [Paenarthrobacter ureafaciens]
MPAYRQTTASSSPPNDAQPRRRKYIATALAGCAALAGLFSLYAGAQGLGTQPVYEEAPTVTRPFTAADSDTYTGNKAVAPDLPPQTVAIPSLRISAPITESGVDADGALILPSSEKTTRYMGAAPIGAPKGSTVIAGHVNFPDGSPGALEPLARAAKGAPIYITDAGGTRYTYTVTSAETLIKTALPAALFDTSGPAQLVLITCGGPIENTGNGILGYTHNTVVTAVPALK